MMENTWLHFRVIVLCSLSEGAMAAEQQSNSVMWIKFETEALEFLHTTKKLPKLEKNPVCHLMLMLALSPLQIAYHSHLPVSA